MATKRTLPTVNIRVADGKGGKLELKAVPAYAIAGAWAVTPSTHKEGLFTVTDMETGMGVSFEPAPLAVAKRAVEALAAHIDEETWCRLARVLFEGEGDSMNKADRDLARSVQTLVKSFAPSLKVTVVVRVDMDGYLVASGTDERIRPMTTKRCPRTVDLTPAQLARSCPQLFEMLAKMPSSGPDPLWYALQRARTTAAAKAA